MITVSESSLMAVARVSIVLAGVPALSLGINHAALAQTAICGDPPPVANETLKGDIEGRAGLLTRFVGDVSLTGRIETSRQEIFSQYPDQEERSDAYFEYMFCVLIMEDQSMTTKEKIDNLKDVRTEFYQLRNRGSGTNINVQNSKSVIIGDDNTMIEK